jgi:hypothetical protein
MRMTIAAMATPTVAPVERHDFGAVTVPSVFSGVELPELVVPPVVVLVLGTGERPDVSVALPVPVVVVLVGRIVLGIGKGLVVSVALPSAEVVDAVVIALVVDEGEDEESIMVLLPGDTYNRASRAFILRKRAFR